jgi:NADH-quinone oxidoreductase subunit M
VILSAVYMLWMFQRVNYGPLENPKNRGLRDLSLREWIVIAPICAAAIGMGVLPGVFLKPMEPAVQKTIQQVVGTRSANADAGPGGSSVAPVSPATGAPVAPEPPAAPGGGQ